MAGLGRVERDQAGRAVRMAGINLDITERKAMEQSLRESEAKYRRLHESMTDAFVSVDMTGRITEFNPAYQALLGYTAEELRTPDLRGSDTGEMARPGSADRGGADSPAGLFRRL